MGVMNSFLSQDNLPRSRPENKPEIFGYPSGIKVEWAVAGERFTLKNQALYLIFQ